MARGGPFPPSAGPLGEFGWNDFEARWIQLVCEHSGMFLSSQYVHWRGCHRSTGPRFIERLVAAGVARVHPLPRTTAGRRPGFCHLFGIALYRALGRRELRHRRIPRDSSLIWARLLSLDAVIEHPDRPWLPGEDDKVRWTDDLGVPRAALPSMVYSGEDGGSTRRYFARWKLPVAGSGDRATFVYADPGRASRSELETWAAAHTPLWGALRKRGVAVEVAVVARTLSGRARAHGWLEGRVGSLGAPFTAADADRLERLEQAFRNDKAAFYRSVGGFGAGLDILGRLRRAKKQGRWENDEGIIDTFSTRVSERVGGAGDAT